MNSAACIPLAITRKAIGDEGKGLPETLTESTFEAVPIVKCIKKQPDASVILLGGQVNYK